MAELRNHKILTLKGNDTTPSLLYNNLTSIDNWTSYVHKNDVVVVDIPKLDSVSIKHPMSSLQQGKVKYTVYQVKAIDVNGQPILCIVAQHSVLFWDLAKESHLCAFQLSDEEARNVYLSRGVGYLPQPQGALVAVGHSNGNISVLDFQITSCSLVKTLQKHTDNISDLAVGACDDLDGKSLIVSADISGELFAWTETLDLHGQASFPGDTITSLQITGAYIAASFGSGLIRLYNPSNLSVSVEITSHARWINALAYYPAANLLASVSEDMLLCVWKLPCKENDCKVQLVAHKLLRDSLLTGVQFLGNSYVATVAYDWDKLHLFDIPT